MEASFSFGSTTRYAHPYPGIMPEAPIRFWFHSFLLLVIFVATTIVIQI